MSQHSLIRYYRKTYQNNIRLKPGRPLLDGRYHAAHQISWGGVASGKKRRHACKMSDPANRKGRPACTASYLT